MIHRFLYFVKYFVSLFYSMLIPDQWKPLVEIFLEYNAQINLSAIRDPEGVYVKHILDSLELLKVIDLQTWQFIAPGKESGWGVPSLRPGWQHIITIADIGTGGGFPLLPLALSFPDVQFVGIDSVRKKIQAIWDIHERLHIKNLRLIRNRIEEMEEQFDIVTARAVAHIEKLLPWTQSLLRRWSKLIVYKEKKPEEKQIMIGLLPLYKLKLLAEHEYSLFEWDIQRVIYVLEKS